MHCISITDDSYNYPVQSDDWYYQEFGYTCPTYPGIAVVQYNRLQIQSASFKTYILNWSIQSGPQSVNFPVTSDIKCILLDIHCPSNRAVYKVKYTVTFGTGPSPVMTAQLFCHWCGNFHWCGFVSDTGNCLLWDKIQAKERILFN